MECASELAEGLWAASEKPDKSYQLNMITIYNKNEKVGLLQILDGQQHMITLRLLMVLISPEKDYLNFNFERVFFVDERSGRRVFINLVLHEISDISRSELKSVDVFYS